MSIKGILLDSGDTLVRPKGGSWWPGPQFGSILQRHGVSGFGEDRAHMKAALEAGRACLEARPLITDCEEEKDLFRGYYRVVCRTLGFSETSDELIEDLVRAYVDACNIELFPDTVETLRRLTKQGVTMGVVSDAWPSLEKKYIQLDIRDYFKSFTISAEVGCYKPCEQIYLRAVSQIGIDPGNLLFVDDDAENVRAAIRLGMSGTVILRNQEHSAAGEVSAIRGLHEIFGIIS